MSEGMSEWIACGSKLVVGDVVRWTETIWPERKRKSRKYKPEPRGKRRVTAQVLDLNNPGYARLSVISDEIVENKYGMPLKSSGKGETIVKKLTTIARGNPERLKWKDEAQRAIEVSTFLS